MIIKIPDDLPIFYSCEMPVRWGDMDAFGHINNTLYFRYFEEARSLLMSEKGITHEETHPVVVNIGCTFLRPLFHPDNLTINLYLADPGRSSFMMYYKLFAESQPESPAAEGYSKVVWVSRKTGKSIPLPDNVRIWFD
jgi:acyl-CoA thioester hydrolase